VSNLRRQNGFGLLEVLVALFVFGIGLLGATALSVQAYRLENRAQIRARIGILAADLIGRVRSNAAGLMAYGGDPAAHGCSSGLTPAQVCTPDELAADDLASFFAALRELAPTATVDLRLDGAMLPPTGRLSIQWSDGESVQHFGADFAL
jgi:type IV pilus assembly protein PilV